MGVGGAVRLEAAAAHRQAFLMQAHAAATELDVRFGRIVILEREAPNLLADLA